MSRSIRLYSGNNRQTDKQTDKQTNKQTVESKLGEDAPRTRHHPHPRHRRLLLARAVPATDQEFGFIKKETVVV